MSSSSAKVTEDILILLSRFESFQIGHVTSSFFRPKHTTVNNILVFSSCPKWCHFGNLWARCSIRSYPQQGSGRHLFYFVFLEDVNKSKYVCLGLKEKQHAVIFPSPLFPSSKKKENELCMRCRSPFLEDEWKLSMHVGSSSNEIYPLSIPRSLCLSFYVFSIWFYVSTNQLIAVLIDSMLLTLLQSLPHPPYATKRWRRMLYVLCTRRMKTR